MAFADLGHTTPACQSTSLGRVVQPSLFVKPVGAVAGLRVAATPARAGGGWFSGFLLNDPASDRCISC